MYTKFYFLSYVFMAQEDQNQMQYDLSQYSELFEELGLNELDENRKQELLGKIMELLELRINDAIYESLTEDQVSKLEQMEDENAIDKFLSEAVPNLEEIATNKSLELRSELVSQASNLDEALDASLQGKEDNDTQDQEGEGEDSQQDQKTG